MILPPPPRVRPRWLALGTGCVSLAFVSGCAPIAYEAHPLATEKTAAALDSRSLADPGLRRFLGENLGPAFAAAPAAEWDFETLAWAAFYYNPTLDVARAQWESARAAAISAGARPNPTLALTPGYGTNPGVGVSPWFPAIAFDFPLETAGKRDRRADAARHAAEAAHQAVFTAAWSVRRDLRRALADGFVAQTRLRLLQAQSALQQHALDLLEQRLQAGAIAAPEVATARLAALRADTLTAAAARQIPLVRQRIATVLGLPVAALEGVTLATPPTLPRLPPAVLAAARRQSLQTRADVLAALARYKASDSALALEVARQYPDVHLGPGYQWDQGQNKWSVGVTFELPVFHRNAGPIAEAAAHRREAAAQFLATQAQALAEIDAAATALTSADAQLGSQRQIQQQLIAQYAQVELRQRTGAADRLEVTNAQLEVATGELALADASAQAALAAGELEDALQVPFAHFATLEKAPGTASLSPP